MDVVESIMDVIVGNIITAPIGLLFASTPDYSWAGVAILSLLALSDITIVLKVKTCRGISKNGGSPPSHYYIIILLSYLSSSMSSLPRDVIKSIGATYWIPPSFHYPIKPCNSFWNSDLLLRRRCTPSICGRSARICIPSISVSGTRASIPGQRFSFQGCRPPLRRPSLRCCTFPGLCGRILCSASCQTCRCIRG